MLNRHILPLFVAAALSVSSPWAVESAAQGAQSKTSETWTFENRPYFDPAVAEIHAADVTATVPG
jgi:hypothetical protein